MGVPGLFGYCLKKFGNLNLKKINKTIDILFIDGNGFIYNAVGNVLNELNKVSTKSEIYFLICEETSKLLNSVIDEIKPTYLYLTFDGVAPMAKINQQRSRRYKTKYEDDFKESLDKKYNKKPKEYKKYWSNVLITPGTEFMDYLNHYFKNQFKDKPNYIYDGSDNIGEGEHKILNYIRNNNNIQNKNIVVHGLDGDLIFLLMLTDIDNNKNNQIYIYRELVKTRLTKDHKSTKTTIKSYLDINDLKIKFTNHITDLIKTNVPIFEFTENNLIDFIFICFFIGNDFLPCQRFVDIYENGLDTLINNYITTITEYHYIIKVKGKNIEFNILALLNFLQLCTLSEYNEFIKLQQTRNKNIYFKIEKLKQKYNNLKDGYERELFKFENNNLTITNYQNLYCSFDDYQFEFYKHFTRSVNNQKQTINIICSDYLKMLKWNIEYYLFGCSDWLMFYKYSISPFFCDLLNYISSLNININQYPKIINKPIDSKYQLLLCIPKKYLKMYIPEVFKMINFKNAWLFPDNYEIDRTNQIHLYKSVVQIPIIDFNKIQQSLLIECKNKIFIN